MSDKITKDIQIRRFTSGNSGSCIHVENQKLEVRFDVDLAQWVGNGCATPTYQVKRNNVVYFNGQTFKLEENFDYNVITVHSDYLLPSDIEKKKKEIKSKIKILEQELENLGG